MSFYREQILPRLTDRAFRGEEAARLRARATAGLSGEVLEIGFGPGRTMPAYPPAVTRVRAVEPSAVARKLAAGNAPGSTSPGSITATCTVRGPSGTYSTAPRPSHPGHSALPTAARAAGRNGDNP